MVKEYLGITNIFTSRISKVGPTTFEKIFEKTTTKKSLTNLWLSQNIWRGEASLRNTSNTCLAKWGEGEEKEINRPVSLTLVSNDMEPIAKHGFCEDKKWR